MLLYLFLQLPSCLVSAYFCQAARLEPFQRLIQKKQLLAYEYNGFWACMDTFKEKQMLDDLYARGEACWEVWKTSEGTNHKQPVRV